MKRITLSSVFLVLTAGLAIGQSTPRRVRIELTLPNGAHPTIQLYEGRTGSVEIPNTKKFGFVPTVKPGDTDTLIVEVLDLSQTPARKLDTVETSIHAAAVPAKTSPRIAIRAIYIETRH